MASKTASSLIFAHVRATTEGNLSDSNCHPFSHKSLMFMHNGNIAGWRDGVKRSVAVSVREKWFQGVEGSTDSEWAFAVFLDCLSDLGHDPDANEERYAADGFGHAVLRKAILKTIARINGFVADARPADARSLLNFAVTDGKSVVCTRYVSSRTDDAASLYFSSGTNWQRDEDMPASSVLGTTDSPCDPNTSSQARNGNGNGNDNGRAQVQGEYKMQRLDRGSSMVLVASEPLTFERDDWVTVPTNSTLTIFGRPHRQQQQTVLIHPIVDEFFHPSPAYQRSGGLVASKGLDGGVVGRKKEGMGEGGTDGLLMAPA